MASRATQFASTIALAAAVAVGSGQAVSQQPKPEDIEKHETTPGDRYVPELNVLKDAPIERLDIASMLLEQCVRIRDLVLGCVHESSVAASTAAGSKKARRRRRACESKLSEAFAGSAGSSNSHRRSNRRGLS